MCSSAMCVPAIATSPTHVTIMQQAYAALAPTAAIACTQPPHAYWRSTLPLLLALLLPFLHSL